MRQWKEYASGSGLLGDVGEPSVPGVSLLNTGSRGVPEARLFPANSGMYHIQYHGPREQCKRVAESWMYLQTYS